MAQHHQTLDRLKIIAVAAAGTLLLVGLVLGWRSYAEWRRDRKVVTSSFDQNRLLGTTPIPFSATTLAVALSGGKADFIEWNGLTLIRRDGVSGKAIWDASRPEKPWDPNRDPVAWIKRLAYYGDDKRPGRLVQPAPDLNGDGTGDLVWVIEGAASILALSGKDGSMLWTCSAKLDGPGGPDPAGPAQPRRGDAIPALARLFADPVATDVDGDGIVDVIAPFAMLDAPPLEASGDPTGRLAVGFSERTQSQPIVVAVSGRTGRWLWNYALPPKRNRGSEQPERALSILKGQKGSVIAVADQKTWIGLDPATGRPSRGPIELNVVPVRPVQYADLNGDGEPDVLAVGYGAMGFTLVAVSSVTGVPLWSATVLWERYLQDPSLPLHWPLVADLDGDGQPEIVVGDVGVIRPVGYYRGVRMLDGATGRTRWVSEFSRLRRGDGLYHLMQSPDLDGDGTSDIVAVSLFTGPQPYPYDENWIYVDALSARDGRSFWSWRTEMTVISGVRSPLLWGRGRDGWPLLAVIFAGRSTSAFPDVEGRIQSPAVCLLEASTGRPAHVINDLSWPAMADLDGDKIDDLWGATRGELRAFRAERRDARGATVQVSPASMDPRWARSLPWYRGQPWIHPSSFIPHPFPQPWSGGERDALWAYTGLVGLTLFVIVIPVAILRQVMRRRFKSVRILAALPLAAALPLTAYVLTIRSSRPRFVQPTAWSLIFGFIMASVAGMPILAYLFLTGSFLFRRRRRQLAGWFALTAVSGLMLGLFWIRFDMQSMASIEHYSWSGWYQPVVPGAYNLGALLVIAWIARGAFRFVKRRLTQPAAPTPLRPV
jgi:hypothetical protein